MISFRSGLVVDPASPHTSEVPDLSDIAWGLAHTLRFNGQLEVPLDVASHSMALASIMPSKWRLRALLHDAAEVILGDMAKPVKHMHGMLRFRVLDREWQDRIYGHYGIEADANGGWGDPDEFKEMDLALTLHEAEMLGSSAFARSIATLAAERYPGVVLARHHRTKVNPLLLRAADLTGEQAAQHWHRSVLFHMKDSFFCL